MAHHTGGDGGADRADEPNRRQVLATLGSAVGATGLFPTASASPSGEAGVIGGVVPLEVDEKDMPIEKARLWPINGTERAVDIYINYAETSLISDVKPMSIGSVLDLDGSVDMPFGTYTFTARDKGEPDGPILAEASVEIDQGDSFSFVLHRVGEADYRMSIYRNDYSPSEDARLVVRHTAYPEQIEWRIDQNGETPRVPNDPRSGSLERGQWQEATDVTEADYRLEALIDGEIASLKRDLELEIETTYVAYVVGNPEPFGVPSEHLYEELADSGVDEGKWILIQAFEVFPGQDEPDTVTPAAPPVSDEDTNQPIQFDCEPVELYETNVVETDVAATDPDGLVTGLAIDAVDPTADAFTVVDNSVNRAHLQGQPTTGTIRIGQDLPPDTYDVTIVANPESLGAEATCTVPVTVKQITLQRLHDLVGEYHASGDIEEPFASDLHGYLDDADAHLAAGETTDACVALKSFLDLMGANKDKGVSETALNDIQPETTRFRKRLGCG